MLNEPLLEHTWFDGQKSSRASAVIHHQDVPPQYPIGLQALTDTTQSASARSAETKATFIVNMQEQHSASPFRFSVGGGARRGEQRREEGGRERQRGRGERGRAGEEEKGGNKEREGKTRQAHKRWNRAKREEEVKKNL